MIFISTTFYQKVFIHTILFIEHIVYQNDCLSKRDFISMTFIEKKLFFLIQRCFIEKIFCFSDFLFKTFFSKRLFIETSFIVAAFY